MRVVSLKKGAVAIAAALGLFLAFASPASANTVGVEITGGSLTAAGNTFDLTPGSGGTPPCPEKADNINATFTGTSASGTWSLTGATWSSFFQLGTPPSGPWYQADFSIVSGNGTYAATGGSPAFSLSSTGPNHLIAQVRVYQVDSGGTCAKDLLKCTITVRLQLTAGSSYVQNSLPTAVTGDDAVINASSISPHISVSGCSAPFVSWAGQTATLNGLALQVL